jgi:hypothetical protein
MSSASSKIEKYTLEFKRKLKERIEKINSKDNVEKIKQIIFKNNPNISYTQNSSGVLLFFHNLTDITYQKLDMYLKKIEFEKIKQLTTTNISDEDIDAIDIIAPNVSENINNIRLSSLEKNIIKKKDYYEKLKEENNVDTDVIYKSDDDDMDIFLNKDILSEKPLKATNKKTPTKSKTNKIKN